MNYSPGWRSLPEEDVKRLTEKLLGKEMGMNELGQLVAAPEGSEIEITDRVGPETRGEEGEIKIVVRLPDERGEFTRRFTGNGAVIHDNFDLEETGTGEGLRIFATAVDNYVELGLTRIETFAAGSPGSKSNGYYTWARFGFESDEAVEGQRGSRLPVSDLMRTSEGRSWWKAEGHGFDATFDLQEGSQSREVLAEYMKLKRSQR
jgi:hypothetical protein